jgi:hypothetical protein
MCARARDSDNTSRSLSASGSPLETRRSFLGALLGVGSVCVGALLSVPLIRFALFPLLRRTTELKGSSVGEVREFSSLTEPLMRTIQIEQVDGWAQSNLRKSRLYNERQARPASRSYIDLPTPWLHGPVEQGKKSVHLPLPWSRLCARWSSRQRPVSSGDGYAGNVRRGRPAAGAIPIFPATRFG